MTTRNDSTNYAQKYGQITRDGLWTNNVAFSQGLALCPLLAVTSTATNGLGMGLATTVVLIASSALISAIRELIAPGVRIPIFVLLIAVLVTIVDLSMNAWLHELHQVLGLFIALIVTNCAIFGRAEAFASKNTVVDSTLDGAMMGLGFTLALVMIGAFREIIGSGTLFAGASNLLGSGFTWMELTLIPDYKGFLLMILPPGGFIAMGCLLAGKRILDQRFAEKRRLSAAPAAV